MKSNTSVLIIGIVTVTKVTVTKPKENDAKTFQLVTIQG